MRGRRGTLQPLRTGRKSPTLFAPSRSPFDAIAPSATTVSIAASSITETGRQRSDINVEMDTNTNANTDLDLDLDLPQMDHYGSGPGEESSSASLSASLSTSSTEESTQQSLVYSLQDENADLQKAIQSLEIVLRDQGFAKDGKLIVPTDEIVQIEHDNDQDGNQRSHMEMVSMMGMDPERPTVLTRYMQFKVEELQEDLERMESERDRFAMMVKNLTTQASAQESFRVDKIKDSKSQKRKLEEKLKGAIRGSKTRETRLSEKVGGLESNLEAFQKKERLLLDRISELEKTLSENLLAEHKEKTAFKEQITALETNLEWNIEEHTKQDTLLRGQITALETNLEWNIDKSTRQEEILQRKISQLETSNNEAGNNGSGNNDDQTDQDDDDENSIDQEDLLTGPGDYFKPLHKATSPDDPSPVNTFQQSLSDISKYHNAQLEEWKKEESKEREEQLVTQINALETNLEWNMQESNKEEAIFREQISALETNLEWNIEESTKREALLQEQINELENKKEEDSLTIDSLVPPDDFLEQKIRLEKINQQNKSLEELLTKVVEESTKREKNLQQTITGLETTAKASVCQEELLRSRATELEAQVGESHIERAKQGKLQDVFEAALEKEFQKQDTMAKRIAVLKETIRTNHQLHDAQQDELLSRIAELARALEYEKTKHKNTDNTNNGASNDKEKEILSGRISCLEQELESGTRDAADLRETLQTNNQLHEAQQDDLLSRIADMAEALEEEKAKDKTTSNGSSAQQLFSLDAKTGEAKESISGRISFLEQEVESKCREVASLADENDGLSTRIAEIEEELKSAKKDKVYRNEIIAELHADLEKAIKKNDGITGRIFELENEKESYRSEKLDQNKRLSKLKSDIAEIAQKNEGLSETVMELESDLEYERKQTLKSNQCIAELQNDLEHEQYNSNKRIEELQDDIEKAIQQAPRSAPNGSESNRKNHGIASRIVELENELESYRIEKFDQNKRVAKLQSDIEEIAQKNEGLSETVMELESDLEYERKEKFDSKNRIAELQSELENTIQQAPVAPPPNESKSIGNNIEGIASRIAELENEVESYRLEKFERNKKFGKLQSYIEEITQKNEGLSETVMELESDLEYERKEKYDRIAEMQSDLKNATIQQSPLSALNAHLEKEAEANELERKSLVQRLGKLQDEFDTNAKFFKSMKAYNHNLEIEHESLKAERERLHKHIQVLREEEKDTPTNFSSSMNLESPIQNYLQSELESARKEQGRLRKCVEELTQKLEESNSNEKTTDAAVIPEIENESEPERTNAKKGHGNKTLAKARTNVIMELKNELENRERMNELSELKAEVIEAAIRHKAIEEELTLHTKALESELEFGQHEHERLERVIFVIRNELKMAAENHLPVVARNQKLEKELESYKVERENLENLKKEVVDLKDELETTNKGFHNNTLDLKMKLKSKQSEFEHLNEFKHELEAELEEMTEKVRRIEIEFEAAANTMDATYGELSINSAQIEKELDSYKSENQYLSKFIEELQNELEDKLSIKREAPLSIRHNPEPKRMDSINELSERSCHDELIESERLNGNVRDQLVENDRRNHSKLSSDLSIDEDSAEELHNSGKTDDELESSSSSSSNESKKIERERLASKISKIEKEVEAEKSKRESLKKSIDEFAEKKAKIKVEDSAKSTKTLTAKILESEAELEALNAHIYELEADLEDLLDELWDFDQDQESDIEEHEQDLDDRISAIDDGFRTNRNREHLSSRVLELEKEMEELEDELEDTIERSKSQRQTLVVHSAELEKRFEATMEKAEKEQSALTFRNSELEKELERTIEKSRKDQQVLAIHYIEKERELKDMAKKADVEERRLKSQIVQLEKDLESNRDAIKNEDECLFMRLTMLMEDTDNINNDEKLNGDIRNHAKEVTGPKDRVLSQKKQSEEAKESRQSAQERLVAKILELKKQYDISVKQNKVLNETIVEVESKLQSSQETIQRAEKEVEDSNAKYVRLETKCKNSDEDNETAIWEAEQKMRDLIETANLERKEKNRFKEECKTIKADIHQLREENEKLSSQNDSRETLAREEENQRESLVRRVAELEENNRIASTNHDIEHGRITKRIEDLHKQLEASEQAKENISSQIQSHEAEKKEHAILSDRFGALEKELQSTIEKCKSERKLHSELKERLVEITLKNQAERANLDNRLCNLQKELELTREKNKSLSAELKFFEKEKNQLNISGVDLEDELRSTFEENENIFGKIQSYERSTDDKLAISPLSNDRTVTENTDFDEDTLTSDRESSPISSPISSSGSIMGGIGGQGEVGVRGNDSNHNSMRTTRAANGGLHSASLLVESDDIDGMANRPTVSDTEQNQRVEDYLSPLVEKADKVLGQEMPIPIVEKVLECLILRAEEVVSENLLWEDFESILEEVCQNYDQDTWFDIQEAFFVAWEEINIQKMGGNLEHQDRDGLYDQ